MGKKYTDSVKLIEKNRAYDPAEALALVCQTTCGIMTSNSCGIWWNLCRWPLSGYTVSGNTRA